jgi:hypothetical protein
MGAVAPLAARETRPTQELVRGAAPRRTTSARRQTRLDPLHLADATGTPVVGFSSLRAAPPLALMSASSSRRRRGAADLSSLQKWLIWVSRAARCSLPERARRESGSPRITPRQVEVITPQVVIATRGAIRRARDVDSPRFGRAPRYVSQKDSES